MNEQWKETLVCEKERARERERERERERDRQTDRQTDRAFLSIKS